MSSSSQSTSLLDTEETDPHKWTKLDRIRYLLDHWSDIFDPNIASSLNGSRGGSGLDPRLPLMAHNSSVAQLVSSLTELKFLYPNLHDHLMAYRADAEWRQVKCAIKFRGPNGRMIEGFGWAKERIVPRWIDPLKVVMAEKWLEQDVSEEVFIPKELWDGLTKM